MPAPLWLDAGVRSVDDARRAIDLGASRVIVGLETLPSFEVLSHICTALGSDRVAFSLDLRDGQPIVTNGAQLRRRSSPEEIAETGGDFGSGHADRDRSRAGWNRSRARRRSAEHGSTPPRPD